MEAGNDIAQVAAGPERKKELEKVLRIPALSAGWRGSFQALLDGMQGNGAIIGNPGLSPAAGERPAWAGFRPLRVS